MLPQEALFIKGPKRLTQGQVKVVNFISSQPEEAVFLTAAQLGQRLGVSDATVIRLAQTLGFKGYSELRQHLRQHLKRRWDTVSRLKETTVSVKSVTDVLSSVLNSDLNNLRLTAQATSAETFTRVVTEIHRHEFFHLIGLRSAHALALFMASAMRYLGRKVHLLKPGPGDLWTDLGSVGEGSLLIAFSFPRYTRLTIEVAQHFKQMGGTVISFTDSAASPLALQSDHALPCSYRLDSYLESFVSALSLVNAVATAVAFLDGEVSIQNLRRLEKLWEQKKVYL